MSDLSQPIKASGDHIPGLPPSERVAAGKDESDHDAAKQELESLSQGRSEVELKKQASVAEFGRSERFRDHFERLAILALWVSAIAISALGLIWLAHMVLPAKWRWLVNEDLTHIQSIVTAGLLVGVIGNHFRKRLS